jgi:hypothetical protein
MKVSNEKGIKWQVDKYMERERERELATEDGKNNLLICKNCLQRNAKPNPEAY